MSYNNRKASSEPQNAEKLTAELQKCVELQEVMRGVNEHWRKTGTCMGAPGITDAQAARLDKRIRTTSCSWERQPFSSYELTNNNSQIKRLEKKLSEVSRGFAGWEFEGGRAEANTDTNRLQLLFDEKPNEQQRAALSGRLLRTHGSVNSPTTPFFPQGALTSSSPRTGGRFGNTSQRLRRGTMAHDKEGAGLWK